MHMELPYITVLLVVRDEERCIQECLWALNNQSYPRDSFEVIFIDGMSGDATMEKVHEVLADSKFKTKISFFENPKKILAAGWNIGITHTKSEYMVRLDAHAIADRSFLLESVKTMQRVTDAWCVGGRITAVAKNPKGKVYAEVLSSPFGIGNAQFRYTKKSQYTDTVPFALCRRSMYDEVGMYDESIVRCQDREMNARIREHGGKFYLNPKIHSGYYCNDTFEKLTHKGFMNGKWTMIVHRKNKRKLLLRHTMPLVFVLSLLALLGLGFVCPWLWYTAPGIVAFHILCGFVFAAMKTKKLTHIFQMPFLFLALHICYGFGSINGMLVNVKK